MSTLPELASPLTNETHSVSDPFDTPLFNRLLGLIEKQNAAVEEQRKTLEEQKVTMKDQMKILEDHGKKFDVLIRDALKGQSIHWHCHRHQN